MEREREGERERERGKGREGERGINTMTVSMVELVCHKFNLTVT